MSMSERDIKYVEGLHDQIKQKDKMIDDLHYTLDLRNITINDLEVEVKRLRSDREYSA